MEQAATVGPRLSDAEFFSRVDTTRPAWKASPRLWRAAIWTARRRLFADEVRRTLQPERFLHIDR